MKIRIGTRGSKLALVQTEYVKQRLQQAYPQHQYEIVVIRTKGDMIQDKPLHQIGAKGLFVQEIEAQLINGDIELAVHSMKDMPSQPEEGLGFSKMWKREDPRDVLVLRQAASLETLRAGAVIGTGSLRRAVELRKLRPDIQVVDIRGNVDTRLRKMEEQQLDGLVLAAAGLKRLNMEDRITCYLEPEQMLPAPAQGILALEYALDNNEIAEMLNALSDEETDRAGTAERAFLREMGGDCQIPVGAFCAVEQGRLSLRVAYGRRTGEHEAQMYYAESEGADSLKVAKTAADKIRRQMAGTVYLVSAGPGDTGLLTVRGKELLERADCVVYDRLVSPKFLEMTKENCEKIYVGKENHNHTMKQEEIQKLLVKKALEYDTVVRLKGGDAYVFGRGGEEALWLLEHGIPFEEVPGVTSAIAGPACAGIPVTHRGLSQGLHIVTAHNRQDELADIDFAAMARGNETCIFLMGLGKLKELVQGLLDAGMSDAMPAAVISHATMPEQKSVAAPLGELVRRVGEAELTSPALIVVGQVAALEEKLGAAVKKPLGGQRYLVPKIGTAQSKLTVELEHLGAAVDEIKVGEIRWKEFSVTGEKLRQTDWLIFTSVHGVEGFFRGLREHGLDTRALGNCNIAAVGAKTAKRLETFGILADVIPQRYDAEQLGQCLREKLDSGNLSVVYVKAAGVENELREILSPVCRFEELEVYENAEVPLENDALEPWEKYDGICFTCSSSVERIFQWEKAPVTAGMTVVSIGKKTSATLQKMGISQILEAREATCESMVKILLENSKKD